MMEDIIHIAGLKTYLGGNWVHQGIHLDIKKNEIIAIVGGSGCGKTTLLREILGLLKPQSGIIELFGKNIWRYKQNELRELQQHYGVLFQQGALFSALTVLENVMFPMQVQHKIKNLAEMQKIALEKIKLVGLSSDSAAKYPSELSGGMQKRAALARALALEPKLLFLDEPSAGLDPVSASAQDQLLLNLHRELDLTIVMVTHDLATLATVATRIVFLGEGKVLAEGDLKLLRKNQHPLVYEYFHNARVEE